VQIPPGAQCQYGGEEIETLVDGGVQQTALVCNGGPVATDGGAVACSAGALQCSGQQPQECGDAGGWSDIGPTCTSLQQACVAGACVGVCAPATTYCASATSEMLCVANGEWTPEACAAGCSAPDGGTSALCCGAGTVLCGGACVPDQSDPNNCGGCGISCGANACVAGACLPPSCAATGPGLTDCGTNGEGCCLSLEVPGGTFYRTYDIPAGSPYPEPTASGVPTGESDPATVSSFSLDKYLVTVGRYRQFLAAVTNGYSPPAGSGTHAYLNGGNGLADPASPGSFEPGWQVSDNANIDMNGPVCPGTTWTGTPGPSDNQPVNCLTWAESYAFCIWDGGFLPSEAEWEYAAAGGAQQRQYPWGWIDPGTTNEYAIFSAEDQATTGCYYPSFGVCSGAANIAPVGSAPLGQGLWGQLDLAGNVLEWNLDWFSNPYVDPCTDCATLTQSGGRDVRGGCFTYTEQSLMPSMYYAYLDPAVRSDQIGARCARPPSVTTPAAPSALNTPATAGTSCNAILQANPSAASGPYFLNTTGTPFIAQCDMATEGGGWTLCFADRYQGKGTDVDSAFDYLDSVWDNGSRLFTQGNAVAGNTWGNFCPELMAGRTPPTQVYGESFGEDGTAYPGGACQLDDGGNFFAASNGLVNLSCSPGTSLCSYNKPLGTQTPFGLSYACNEYDEGGIQGSSLNFNPNDGGAGYLTGTMTYTNMHNELCPISGDRNCTGGWCWECPVASGVVDEGHFESGLDTTLLLYVR
jgi:formylglycine-generating enzyme required for sulfatase activity